MNAVLFLIWAVCATITFFVVVIVLVAYFTTTKEERQKFKPKPSGEKPDQIYMIGDIVFTEKSQSK